MENSKIYRVLIVGPTGAGKSQFCNFVQKDMTNSINEVRFSLNSCTQDPRPNLFERKGTNYEFIDSAGNGEKPEIDEENFKRLIDYLKSVKKIDYILFLLSFVERLTNDTRNYIKKLGKIFTPMEFYNHASFIFTKSPQKISTKSTEKREIIKKEIIEILKETFNPKDTIISKTLDVYFIDTEIDEETNSFNEKSQITVDILLDQIKLNVKMYKSIKTTNFDITGENVNFRIEIEQNETHSLKKKIEEIQLQKENEKKEKEKLENDIKNLENNGDKKEKEKKLEEIIKKEKEEKKIINETIKNNKEPFLEKQKEINERANKNQIFIDHLNEIRERSNITFKIISALGALITLGGVALTIPFPTVGPIVVMAGFGIISGGLMRQSQQP